MFQAGPVLGALHALALILPSLHLFIKEKARGLEQ